jgi:NAD(P)-dependent dehydrogenase (short-subunit alcohol dehydrogenase family)
MFMTEANLRWSKIHPEVVERYRSQVPLGDFGNSEDLGALAVFLASDAARYMTGASLVLDGGFTLC